MYRIKYWDESNSSGCWALSGLMSRTSANDLINSGLYNNSEIVIDDEYKMCRNCAFYKNRTCKKHASQKTAAEDICGDWLDNC